MYIYNLYLFSNGLAFAFVYRVCARMNHQVEDLTRVVQEVAARTDLCLTQVKEMSDLEQKYFHKEFVMLENRCEMVNALLDPSPTKLQAYISQMASTANSPVGKIFLPGPPSSNYANAISISQLMKDIEDWAPQSAPALKELQKAFMDDKKTIQELVASAKGICSDFTKAKNAKEKQETKLKTKHQEIEAKQAAEVANKQADVLGSAVTATAAVPRKNKTAHVDLFEAASQIGRAVDRAPQGTFDPRSPFLVSAATQAASIKEGPLKTILEEFGTQFSKYQKSNPIARAAKKITDMSLASAVENVVLSDLFGPMLPFGRTTCKEMPAGPTNLEQNVLNVALFGIGQGLEFESSDKECSGNIRWILQGTRQVILVHGAQLIQYMKSKETSSASVANPHEMQRAYAFLKYMTLEMLKEYVADNDLFQVTTGPGDALYAPAGMFFAEKVGVQPGVLGIRLGLCIPHEPDISCLIPNLDKLNKNTSLMKELVQYRETLTNMYDSKLSRRTAAAAAAETRSSSSGGGSAPAPKNAAVPNAQVPGKHLGNNPESNTTVQKENMHLGLQEKSEREMDTKERQEQEEERNRQGQQELVKGQRDLEVITEPKTTAQDLVAEKKAKAEEDRSKKGQHEQEQEEEQKKGKDSEQADAQERARKEAEDKKTEVQGQDELEEEKARKDLELKEATEKAKANAEEKNRQLQEEEVKRKDLEVKQAAVKEAALEKANSEEDQKKQEQKENANKGKDLPPCKEAQEKAEQEEATKKIEKEDKKKAREEADKEAATAKKSRAAKDSKLSVANMLQKHVADQDPKSTAKCAASAGKSKGSAQSDSGKSKRAKKT